MIRIYLLVAIVAVGSFSHAQNILSMDEYLGQVRGANKTYIGSVQYRNGAVGRASEADLVTSFRLTGQKLHYNRGYFIFDLGVNYM